MNPVEKIITHPNEIYLLFVNISSIYKKICNLDLPERYQIEKPIEFNSEICELSWLTGYEIDKINTFKTFKKQIEWISGRFALKSCIVIHDFKLSEFSFEKLSEYFDKMKQYVIEYEEKGAPYIKNHPHMNISLSHSGNYSVCIIDFAGKCNVAVDVEKNESKNIETIMKVAFTIREKEIVQKSLDSEKEFYRIWTGKESYLKILKKGFHEPLKNIEITNGKVFENKQDACVITEFNEYKGHFYSYIIK